MAELALETHRHIEPIPVLLDTILVNIPALLRLDILDRNSPLADNVTDRIWHHAIVREDPLEYDEIW